MGKFNQQRYGVIDLEDIVQTYAWKRFKQDVGIGKNLFLKKEKHDFEIQWTFLDFKHVTSASVTDDQDANEAPMEFGTPMKYNAPSRPHEGHLRDISEWSYKSVSNDLDAPVILCTEYFENETDKKQSYVYSKCENLKSVVSLKFFQSYSLGETTNIELSTSGPTVDGKSLNVKNPVLQEFDDVHTFNIDTIVNVDPGKKAEAVVSVYEKQILSRFELTTTISMVVGCLPVVIRRKTDAKVVYTCFITSLYEVFRKHTSANLSLVNSGRGIYNVIITSRGTLTSTAWSDPELIVKAEPILNKF